MPNVLEDKLRGSKKKAFLEMFTSAGVVQPACNVADVSRRTVLRWRNEDAEFSDAYDEAWRGV